MKDKPRNASRMNSINRRNFLKTGLAAGAGSVTLGVFGRLVPALANPWLGAYPKLKIKPTIPMKATAFALEDVRLLDGPFKHAMELDAKYRALARCGPPASQFPPQCRAAFHRQAAGRMGSAQLRVARPFRRPLPLRVRADVRRHRRRALQGQGRRHRCRSRGMPGQARLRLFKRLSRVVH